MKFLKILSLMAAMFSAGCNATASDSHVEVVEPMEFRTLLSQTPDAYLLDVRRPEEFAAGHLEGAHLLDWQNPETFRQGAADLDKSKTIFVYCRSGRRSNEAAGYLSEQGFTVVDMDGGILDWKKEGLPVTTAIEENGSQNKD